MDNTSVRNTLEIIYLMNELFYGEDKSDWPESAKLFYDRMAVVRVGKTRTIFCAASE